MKSIIEYAFICHLVLPILSCGCRNAEPPLYLPLTGTQIIADHTVVDKFDNIPQEYLAEVKKMWLVVAGESHSNGYFGGLMDLASSYPAYASKWESSPPPEAYTASHLRYGRILWGDGDHVTGWVSEYGEEDWWTNSTAIARTKAGITYCNSHDLTIGAIGFGWCWDMFSHETATVDPVYGCHWFGNSINSPEGSKAWGLDADDNALTGNSVNLDTYLNATQQYIDYCRNNGYPTKVFFTTGPVDDYGSAEAKYSAYLKHEKVRAYVKADTTRILFDYADILCYDYGSETPNTITWNEYTIPIITTTNIGDGTVGHISSAGALRLAKGIWWMLARIAGWDGIE